MDTLTTEPNHHSHYPRFSGISGIVAAASMTFGRSGDSTLAGRLTGVGPGDHLIDVGSGPGAAARRARRRGASVTGVDPAPVMRRTARLLTLGRRGIRYVAGTAEHLPVEDASATVLWSIATVHHWSDIDGGLREAKRVLRSGGRLLALERQTVEGAHGHASHGWTEVQARTFADRLRHHGFTEVRVEGHEGRPSVWSVLATAP